jgi:cytochrome b
MEATSASHAERSDTPGPAPTRPILVWDVPVRVFHWLMVASFATAYLTAETERWRLLYMSAGYTMAGLVVFRLLWGLFGTRHARFVNFVRGPRAVVAYLKSLLARHPQHHAGHNPAGALAIVMMQAVVLVHVAGVFLSSRLHHENLMRAMVTGRKPGDAADGASHAWRSVAALMLMAVLGFRTWQWQSAAAPGGQTARATPAGHHDHDHDRQDQHDDD